MCCINPGARRLAPKKLPPRLGTSGVKDFSSLVVQEVEPERGGPSAEAVEEASALLSVVPIRADAAVAKVSLEGAADEDGELSGGRRDSLWFADAGGQSAIERAQCRLRPPETHDDEPQEASGAIRGTGRARTQQAAP